MSLDSIPAAELPHKVTVRHLVSAEVQDEYGQFHHETTDFIDRCHFEFHTYNDESERVKNKEFVLRYDLLLIMLPGSLITQGDQIMLLKTKSGDTVFEDDDGNNPMTVDRVFKIATDNGVHHIEAYCNFHHPQVNSQI